jgi:hypothetical protein
VLLYGGEKSLLLSQNRLIEGEDTPSLISIGGRGEASHYGATVP